MKIARGGEAAVLVRVSDDVKQRADRIKELVLRVVFFDAHEEGHLRSPAERNPA